MNIYVLFEFWIYMNFLNVYGDTWSNEQMKVELKKAQNCYTKVKEFLWGIAQFLHRASLAKTFIFPRYWQAKLVLRLWRSYQGKYQLKVLSSNDCYRNSWGLRLWTKIKVKLKKRIQLYDLSLGFGDGWSNRGIRYGEDNSNIQLRMDFRKKADTLGKFCLSL